MTENNHPATDWIDDWNELRRRQQEAIGATRAVLFSRLEAAGVTTVTVVFDGCGDSGQIEEIAVC